MNLFFFILGTIGMTNILVHGGIFDAIKIKGLSLREWVQSVPALKTITSCYECMGFWCGLFMGLLLFPAWMFFVCACAGSVLASTFSDLIFWLRSVTQYEI